MERVETKIDRELLEALRLRAADEGREEYEVVEDAARRYLGLGRPGIAELIGRSKECRERAGFPEASEDEAMRIALAEQRAYRTEAGGR